MYRLVDWKRRLPSDHKFMGMGHAVLLDEVILGTITWGENQVDSLLIDLRGWDHHRECDTRKENTKEKKKNWSRAKFAIQTL